jgi:lysyl-tRNA synthetase class 2
MSDYSGRVRARTHAAPIVAAGAALVGVVGIVSALTPELASRIELVRGILPPGWPDAARTLALACGLALVWLSRGLARRKRRAWALAIVVVAASAAAHLAKGLDFEEATASLALLLILWRCRAEFYAEGDPAVLRPLVQLGLALAVVGGTIALRATNHVSYSDRVADALAVLAAALAVRAFYLWLRPLAGRAWHSASERARAEALVRTQGRDSLSYFALRRDKAYFFSPSGRSFLAYRVAAGVAIVSGDPIGDREELVELVREFRRVAAASGWRVGLVHASAELLPLYREAGLRRAAYLGDEAVVEPASFSLEGRAIRKVRQAAARVQREGYNVRFLRAEDIDPELRRELASVSEEWRGRSPERGFSMAMDGMFAYGESVVAVAEGPDGVGGFIHLVPVPASGGWSLAAMRRRRRTPNGLMEFLVVESIAWARRTGVPELSLNFSLFANVLRGDAGPRAFRFALRKLDRFFQLERLLTFNRKFFPVWRRRYVCFERYSDAPALALGFALVEGQLSPPRPWTRSVDLTAS